MLGSRGRSLAKSLTLAGAAMLAIPGCDTRAPPPGPSAEIGCPAWTSFPVDPHTNADSPYLGCATAANLRAMVANAADLQRGRQLGPADGERETLAIEAYQQGKAKALAGAGAMTPQVSMVNSTGGSP